MKLLRWIRTIKQNGLISSTDFNGDLCCLRAKVSSQVQDIRTNSFSFSFSGPSHYSNPPDQPRFDEDEFNGFLAIGTLGRDPETPKFAVSVAEEDVSGAKKEMAKLITEKLDKFLEEDHEDSSSKQIERLNAEESRETDESPRKGCLLFPLSIELANRSNEVKKRKSLLTKLFKGKQRGQGVSDIEKHAGRDLVKKIHGSSSKMRNDDNGDDSMPNKKDLRKSVQIFRSKVHPVLYTPDNKMDDRRSCINHYNLKSSSFTGRFLSSSSISESNKKRENWIKTDAEYLVLEL